MIKKKGEYGYRRYFKIKNGIMISFFIIVILVLFIASKHTKENMSRILTVLPMANLLSPFLVVFKYNSCEYSLVQSFLEDKHFLFDIILTMREQVMPLDIIYIDGERIFGILSNKADKRKTEDFIKERIKLGGISVNVKVCESINELKKFIRASQTENNVDDKDYKLKEIRAILKSLSV